jgi:hypothetical protein
VRIISRSILTLAVNTPDQRISWKRFQLDNLEVLSCGSQSQPVLEKDGGNLRIDWGHLYLAIPPASGTAGWAWMSNCVAHLSKNEKERSIWTSQPVRR